MENDNGPDGDEDADDRDEAEASGDVSLSYWNGAWNNFLTYFENPGLDETYEILAQRDETTAEAVKERYLTGDTYQCDIAALYIDGDTITIYSATQDTAGSDDDVLSRAQYAYQGAVTDGSGRAWDCFTTDEDAAHTVFLLLEAEADVPGETMMHFHFRYGDDARQLLARDGWYPTMIAYDSTDSLIVGHMVFEDD